MIGFAGMTHLGLNSAVAAAARGFNVVAYDCEIKRITELKKQILTITEPELPELLAKHFHQINFSADCETLKACDLVYIAVDVPTNDEGQSDLSSIEALISKVAENLSSQALLIILCQVPPGFTRQLSFPKDRLFYQVETLIFGNAIERAMHPERFIVGAYDPSKALPQSYEVFLKAFACPILPMRYESAELAKIAINCCLVSSIGVANTLSEICEHIGADWSEIAQSLKLDKRIGQFAYLSPGLGIAGGNLERDLNTVLKLSELHGTESGIVKAWIKNNRYRKDWVIGQLHQVLQSQFSSSKNCPEAKCPNIAILGLAYKKNTHSIKNSAAVELVNYLLAIKPQIAFSLKLYDPEVAPEVFAGPERVGTAVEAIQDADILIIMTPWDEFKNLNAVLISEKMKGKDIIDPYQVLDRNSLLKFAFQYRSLGKAFNQEDFTKDNDLKINTQTSLKRETQSIKQETVC